MKEYNAFVLTFEGQVVEHHAIKIGTEAEAIELAKRLIGPHPVELWDGPRRVARFEAVHR